MKRQLIGMVGSVAVLALVASCVDDPTSALRGDIARVSLSRTYVEMKVGGTLEMQAQAYDSQGNALATLPDVAASDVTVATTTVDARKSGDPIPETVFTLRGTGFGATTITASAGGVSTTATVVTYPATVEVSGVGATMGSGTGAQLAAVFLDTDGNVITPLTGANADLVWSSSASSIVTVDSTGAATAKSVGRAKLTVTLENGTSGSADVEVVPGTFAGTLSANSGTTGQIITANRGAGQPVFDSDTRGYVDDVRTFVTVVTADQMTMVVPATGKDGTVEVLFTNLGPDQISLATSMTTTSSLVDTYEPNDGPLAGVTIANGVYYFTLSPNDPDDFFTVVNGTGAAMPVSVRLDWYTDADIDILWTDAGFTAYVGNFSGATGANPENSSVSVPAGTTWNLWVNLYDSGNLFDNGKMTVSGMP